MKFDFGYGTRNMLLNRDWSDAAYRQTALEHQNAIDYFTRQRMLAGEDPLQAQYNAETIDEPEQVVKYWTDDEPRRPVGGESSWIRSLDYNPDVGLVQMNTDNGSYLYPATDDMVGDWVTSDIGVGNYFNNFIKSKG